MQKIASAFVKAQKSFGPALKSNTNPAFRSRYADLADCVEAVIDALNENGIAMMQPTKMCDNGVIVETLFIHESGETMSSGVLHVPAVKHDPQGYGSALTYARRYSLMAACGIAPEDDDGNAASRTAKSQDKQQSKPFAEFNITAALDAVGACTNEEQLLIAWKQFCALAQKAHDMEGYATLKKAVTNKKASLDNGA